MSNLWKNYQDFEEFDVLTAAFLWLEIDPTSEMLKAPFPRVNMIKELLIKKINEHMREIYLDQYNKFKNKGNNHQEAIEKLIKSMFHYGLTKKEVITLPEEEMKIRKNKLPDIPIPENFIMETGMFMFGGYDMLNPPKITRSSLIKIALRIGQKPKFLFPEDREENDSNQFSESKQVKNLKKEDPRVKEKHEILIKKLFSRLSDPDKLRYEKLLNDLENLDLCSLKQTIRDLLKNEGFDPFKRGATGIVESWFDKSKDSKPDYKTIKKILDSLRELD